MTSKQTDQLLIENINIKGGVLIIGSLLWQDHLENGDRDNVRKLWRDRHLLLNHKIMVKVPIRYGRLSKSDIYTMVFSNSCAKNKNGTGYFIPFKQTITTFSDLVSEAKEVSVAEGMKGEFLSKETGTNNVWCVLGILTNPKTISKEQEKILQNNWSEIINSQGGFDLKDFKQRGENSCLDKRGKLNINWPTPLDKRNAKILNSYDFIIATGTKPTKYPNVNELIEKVKSDKTRNYFIENYNSGITTFQDIEVINKL